MKTSKLFAVAAVLFSTAASSYASDIGVSISIGQPGFYGRIDLGDAPRPRVIYDEPIWIERRGTRPAPIYLRVSPGHERDWGKHCKHYNACGAPVYFVHDDWYRNDYSPYYREHHGRSREDNDDHDHGGNKGKKEKKNKHGHD